MARSLAFGLALALVGGCSQGAMESFPTTKAIPSGSAAGESDRSTPGTPPSLALPPHASEREEQYSPDRVVLFDETKNVDGTSDSRVDPERPADVPPGDPADGPVAVAEPPAADRHGQPAARAENPPVRAKPVRRIIYVATLDLVVDDFAAAERAIPELIRTHDGYVSENSVAQRSGSQRGGRWVVRIPVDRYESFLAAIGELGVPENLQQNAQDVSQEFIDLEARTANQKRLEDRILKLLEKNDGGIKDVIEVERELARVRSDIETMEGRLRYLRNQVALTTVTLNVREQQNYTPPQAPSFAGKIGRTWGESLRGLGMFGQGLVLLGVALAPWAAIAVPVFGGAAWFWKRSRRAIDA